MCEFGVDDQGRQFRVTGCLLVFIGDFGKLAALEDDAMGALRCEPAAFESLGLNIDARAVAFSPVDILLDVPLGKSSDDARCNEHQEREDDEHGHEPFFHSETLDQRSESSMLARCE